MSEMFLGQKRERRWLAELGVTLAVSGFVHYQIENTLSAFDVGLLIGGGFLFLVAAVLSYRDIAEFFAHRGARLGTNALTQIVLIVVVLVLVNFLGYRHHKRYDLTIEKLYTLSDQSRHIVADLKEDVEIIRFDKAIDTDFQDLGAEYANINPRVHYREVDPEEQPEIARQYGATDMNQTVVSYGGRNVVLDGSGERDVTDGILRATRQTVKTICSLTGHGERATWSAEQDGYSIVSDQLKREGYQTKDINLVSADRVPPECNVLLVAGPKQPLFEQESQMIAKYLDGGGKALLMFDPETNPHLDSVFGPWNINLGNNVVIDATGAGQMFGTGPAVPLVVDYGNSAITRGLDGTMTFFPLARTVLIADKSKRSPENTELVKTSERSFTVPNLKTEDVKYDPARDTAGPLSLAVSAERRPESAGGTGSSVDARLVVIGNSSFAANQWFGSQRNGDLFLNTINWLAQDENLISIRPKIPTNRRVNLTAAQQRVLSWLSMALLPGIVVLSGILLWLKLR